MKVVFVVPIAEMDNAAIQMENSYWRVKKIMPFLKTPLQVSLNSARTEAMIYVNIDKTIQAGGYTNNAGAFTAGTNFETLDNNRTEVFKNMQAVTITKFQRGVVYLVPATAQGVLNLIPSVPAVGVAGALTYNADIGATMSIVLPSYNGTHFRFDCNEDTDLLGTVSIADCISVDWNGSVQAASDEVRAERKIIEGIQFGIATGNPVAEQAMLSMKGGQ